MDRGGRGVDDPPPTPPREKERVGEGVGERATWRETVDPKWVDVHNRNTARHIDQMHARWWKDTTMDGGRSWHLEERGTHVEIQTKKRCKRKRNGDPDV